MYNLYKTELPNFSPSSKSKNSLPKSTNTRNRKLKINKLLSRKDLNEKIQNISLNRQLLSEKYLDFIIKEKLNYADVDKITNYYSKKIEQYKQKYDENQNLIIKKKEELKDLNMALYTSLVNHIKFETTENVDVEQVDDIEKTKKEIKAKEHQIEIFKDLYNQSYKINLDLSNKFFLENNYSKVYEDQYQRYNNIYKNSISKIQKQEEKLNVLNGYFNKFRNINNTLIAEKVEKLNRLEYEIFMTKNEVIEFEENFSKIQKKNAKFKKLLESAKQEYLNKKNDFIAAKKNYIKEYFKMHEIYGIIKEDDIDDILKKFLIIKQKFNELSFKFNKSSNENMFLRIDLSKQEKKLKEIKAKTKEKKKQTKIDSEKFNKELIEIINIQKNDFYKSNFELFNLCTNKENLIKFEINYLIELNSKIIHSINNSFNKSPILSRKKFHLKQQNQLSEKYNIKSLEMMNDKDIILLIIDIFKNLTKNIYEIIQNVLYNIYILILQPKEEHQNEDLNSNEKKFKIITNNSHIVENTMNSQLKLIKDKLKVKKQIYSRNKDELIAKQRQNSFLLNKRGSLSFSFDNILNIDSKEVEKNFFVKKYKIISHKDLLDEYKDYINYNKKNSLKENLRFLDINKKLFLEEFTNEFVAENDIEKIKDEKNKKVKEASKKIKDRLDDIELKNFIKKKSYNKRFIRLSKQVKHKNLDEQGEEELKEYEKILLMIKNELKESKKPKKFKMKLANPENDLINKRNEDIRTLEINYIKNYFDYRVEQNIFNEYFYNVRKKFIDIDKKQNNYYELNKSLSNRSLINNKRMHKNYSIILPKIKNKAI